MNPPPQLELRRVSKAFGVQGARNEAPVLSELSLSLSPGVRLGLIGPPAAGKTLIMKMLCGLIEPTSGGVYIGGQPLAEASEPARAALRRPFGVLFQNYALFDAQTAAQNVAFPLQRRGIAAPAVQSRVEACLRTVGLWGHETKLPHQLSGGMKKRLGIARAIATEPSVLILDEPTAGLDPVTTAKMFSLLGAQIPPSATVLAISSDVANLARFVDEIAFVWQGSIAWRGPSHALHTSGLPALDEFIRGAFPERAS